MLLCRALASFYVVQTHMNQVLLLLLHVDGFCKGKREENKGRSRSELQIAEKAVGSGRMRCYICSYE